LRPHRSASCPDALHPPSAPRQKTETQKPQIASLVGRAAPSGPRGGSERHSRITPACVFILPLLYPNWNALSSAVNVALSNAEVKLGISVTSLTPMKLSPSSLCADVRDVVHETRELMPGNAR